MDEEWEDQSNLWGCEVYVSRKLIATSRPARFSRPGETVIVQLRAAVQEIIESIEGYVDLAEATLDFMYDPTQRRVAEPVLRTLEQEFESEFQQLNLFTEHPETYVDWPAEGITLAALDLLGAVVLDIVDLREKHLVDDLVGLLCHNHAPLRQIADLTLAMFRVVAVMAFTASESLAAAHSRFVDTYHSKAMT